MYRKPNYTSPKQFTRFSNILNRSTKVFYQSLINFKIIMYNLYVEQCCAIVNELKLQYSYLERNNRSHLLGFWEG